MEIRNFTWAIEQLRKDREAGNLCRLAVRRPNSRNPLELDDSGYLWSPLNRECLLHIDDLLAWDWEIVL